MSDVMRENLQTFRGQIDTFDKLWVSILGDRFEATQGVAELSVHQGAPSEPNLEIRQFAHIEERAVEVGVPDGLSSGILGLINEEVNRQKRQPLEDKEVTGNIEDLRAQIDVCDVAWVTVLGVRFQVTKNVGLLKAREDLNPVDPERETRQLRRLGDCADEFGVPEGLSERILRHVIDRVVLQHKKIRAEAGLDTQPNV